jgi:chromosome segregation ATPase
MMMITQLQSEFEDRIIKLERENRQLKHSISEFDSLHESSKEAEQHYRNRVDQKNREIAELTSELTELQTNYHELEAVCNSHREELTTLSKVLEEKQQEYYASLEAKNVDMIRLRNENQQLKYTLSDLESLSKARSETDTHEKLLREKRREDLQRLEQETKELRRNVANLEDSRKVLELEKTSMEALLASQEREFLYKLEEKNKELSGLHRELQDIRLEIESTRRLNELESHAMYEKQAALLRELEQNGHLLQDYESLKSHLVRLER